MAEEDLRLDYGDRWTRHIQKIKKSLNKPELQTIERSPSFENVQRIIRDGEMTELEHELTELEYPLSFFKAFVEFFETKLGPNLGAQFFWGALASLLQVVVNYPKELNEVIHFVRCLALKADIFNEKCNDPQLAGHMVKETCYRMQTLFVYFFTDVVKYVHTSGGEPHQYQGKDSKSSFATINQFYQTTNDKVEEALASMGHTNRVALPMPAEILPSPNANKASPTFRHLMLPPTSRHFDRDEYFEYLDSVLHPAVKKKQFPSVILYGTEGVGKSTIASTYIVKRYEEKVYDVVLWICAENHTTLRQSFTEIATRLGLKGANSKTPDENFSLVQQWFGTTECEWLVVYDNVESAELLKHYWPRATKGRAIVTASDHKHTFNFPAELKEVRCWTEKEGWKCLVFLLNHSNPIDPLEKAAALSLSSKLDGHPLAILLIAGLIHNWGYSMREILDAYVEDEIQFYETGELAPLFRRTFKNLDKESHLLLGTMSWLMADSIPEELFEEGISGTPVNGLEFCRKKHHFMRVVSKLMAPYLIKRNSDDLVLSTLRVIQRQFKSSLNTEQRQESFDRAVGLLYNILPEQDPKVGQLYRDWETYNRYIQHVSNLKDCFVEESTGPRPLRATAKFCELLIQCQRYLYEINALADLESFCEVSLDAVNTLEDKEKREDLQADIMSYQANRAESLGKAEEAIKLNKEVHSIRQENKTELLGHVTNNLGYCHDSANNHKEALKWFEKSYKWWMEKEIPIPSFILTNIARCKVYNDEISEARQLLGTAFKQLREETRMNWAMLAYTYFAQGTLEQRQEDYESAEKSFRKAGSSWIKDDKNLHPFYGGCMYKIGLCCLKQGKTEEAIENLCISMKATSFHRHHMPVEYLRSYFKLSQALNHGSISDSQREKAKEWLDEKSLNKAKTAAKKRYPNVQDWSGEDACDNFIPIFWR